MMKLRGLAALATVSVLVAVAILSGPSAFADGERRPLYRGTRASAMGGAFIALADDEQAIFMNPAGMAGIMNFTFNYAAVDTEISSDLVLTALTGAATLSSFNAGTLNEFMGKNLYGHVQINPSIVMPNFGFSFLSDHQFSFTERNQANPRLNLGYQSTNGIQMAFGTSVLGKKSKKSDLRIGIGAKMMWRRGGYHELGFLDILALSQDPMGYIQKLNGNYGVGYGVDLGTQYLYNASKRLTLSTALVMTDIGDTNFASPTAEMQKSSLTFGVGASYKLSKSRFNFAYDLRNLNTDQEFRKKSHLGVELILPFVSFQAGVYQMALTYGATFDLWIFRITAASYAEEQGVLATQNPERRYALRFALKIGF